MKETRRYPATVTKVYDGDTLWVNADLGFGITLLIDCRMARINAPEMNTPKGPAARDHLKALTTGDVDVLVYGQEKWRRWLVEVEVRATGENINDRMVTDGFAVPYMT